MVQRARNEVRIGLGDESMPRGLHVCYVFGHDDERFHVLARYYRAGIEDGDKLYYMTDDLSPEELRHRFADCGADLGSASVMSSPDAYYPEGRFIPEAMLASLDGFCRDALEEGYPGVRSSGDMSWALRGVPGSERILEYEVMLNDFCEGAPATLICQYDARRFDGATILDVLDIHPLLIVGGQILRNPNHVRSDDMMRRLRTAAAA